MPKITATLANRVREQEACHTHPSPIPPNTDARSEVNPSNAIASIWVEAVANATQDIENRR